MNQILVTENKKKKGSKGPVGIKGIVRFFAIFIAVFGIVLTGEGSYALYKDAEARSPENVPSLYIVRDGDIIRVRVEHNSEISTLNYSWNDGVENQIPEGGTYAEEEIIALDGNNVLNITVVDMKGREYQYQKEFLLDGVDITKPNIEVLQVQEGTARVSINTSDETQIVEMSYKVNDAQEIIIQATEQGQTEINEEITLPEGTNKLIVTARDASGNITRYEKEIIVSSKPTIELISKEGTRVVFRITDQSGIQKVTVNLNGREVSVNDINQTEATLPLDLQEGNNVLRIEVTNVNGLVASGTTQIEV